MPPVTRGLPSLLVVSPANNGVKSELLYRTAEAKYPTEWTRDGKFLLFGVLGAGGPDIWGMSVSDKHPGPLFDTIYNEIYASVSPNGKWIAYQTDSSGRMQVQVAPFDGISRGTKRTYEGISLETGGGLPRWRADGKELFYISGTGTMMSVPVNSAGDEFQHGKATPLFTTRTITHTFNLYDVSADGQRFIVNLPLEWAEASPVTVMTNWTEKLKKDH